MKCKHKLGQIIRTTDWTNYLIDYITIHYDVFLFCLENHKNYLKKTSSFSVFPSKIGWISFNLQTI